MDDLGLLTPEIAHKSEVGEVLETRTQALMEADVDPEKSSNENLKKAL
jgi:hypothetical protein